MEQLSLEEVNELGNSLCDCKNKYDQKLISKSVYDKTCSLILKKLSVLVYNRTSRYKQYSNYEDLVQEGMVGLMLAIKRFNPAKGNFAWWANHYIGTKISRSANNHSCMKIPIKKTKFMKPVKLSIDGCGFDCVFNEICKSETYDVDSFMTKQIKMLDGKSRIVLNEIYFGNHKTKEECMNKICSLLNINKQACSKVIIDVESSFKEKVKVNLGIL